MWLPPEPLDPDGLADRTVTGSLVMACSVQKDGVAAKVRADVNAICGRGEAVQAIAFFTVQEVPVAMRHRLQEETRAAHGVQLQIFDGQAMGHMLAEDDLVWIAERYLHLPSHLVPDSRQRQSLRLGDSLPGAIRARDASWSTLGVHRPIQADGADPGTLPAYVPRDIDDLPGIGLREQLKSAAERGGFVVLVGESSTGKTRSLFEAVTALLGDWWLLRPADPPTASPDRASRSPASLVDVAGMLPSRLVVWLDDLHSHIESGRLEAATARQLINSGAVLAGTLWPHLHAQYTAPPPRAFAASHAGDPHQAARELLDLAAVIHMPRMPTGAESARARELAKTANGGAGDARLKAALEVTGYGFTQVIAAAPQLVNRWNSADPYARAVLAAAVDASRLGARSLLPAGFLQVAAPGYCSPAERAQAPTGWFEQALAYGTRLLLGAIAPLTPVASGMSMGVISGYRLADYIAQHAEPERRPHSPPATFWDACITHLADPGDLGRLGNSAADRMRYRYAILLLRSASPRDSYAATRLAFLVGDQGHVDEAIAILRGLAMAGDPVAEYQAAEMRRHAGEYRAAARRSTPTPAQIAHLLKGLDGSRRLRQYTDSAKIREMATEMFGDADDLRRRYRADSSDANVAYRLVDLLACTGDFGQMLPILYALVNSGDPYAHGRLFAALVELGRSREALQLARYGLTADGHTESQPVRGEPDTRTDPSPRHGVMP